jgi:hypothetical protein
MATRNIVPRANEEGNIGTSLKNWLKGWFKDLFISGNLTDGEDSVAVSDLSEVTNINTLDEKETPHNDDIVLIEDSESGNLRKKVKIENIGGDSDQAIATSYLLN